MKRRSLLSMLGLAPAAVVVKPAEAVKPVRPWYPDSIPFNEWEPMPSTVNDFTTSVFFISQDARRYHCQNGLTWQDMTTPVKCTETLISVNPHDR